MGGPPGEETSALSAGEHCSIPGWQEGPFFGLVDQVRREAALRLGALVFAGDCKVRCGLSSLLSPVFKEGLIKSERLIDLSSKVLEIGFNKLSEIKYNIILCKVSCCSGPAGW